MSRSFKQRLNQGRRIISFGLLCFALSAGAQTDIPVGDWRLHLSYNNIQHIEISTEKIYAASESGILVYNRSEQTLSTYNKLNGLSSTGISSLGYNGQEDQLLVGYEDGDLDIVQGNNIANFNRLKNADVTTSKKINHISVRDNIAYLSTAYGVVLFDLQQLEIKETWRDLGASGENLSVYQSTFLHDSIFISTAHGVLAGKQSDNLLDFNNWSRFNPGGLTEKIRSIISFNNKVYATGPTGVYRFADSDWVQEIIPELVDIQSMTSSLENLFMITDSDIRAKNVSGQVVKISDNLIAAPATVKQDEAGIYWIGDRSAGLISNAGGTFASYLPEGPSLVTANRMVYDNGKIYVLGGGYSASGLPLNTPGHLNIFENGTWQTIHDPVTDLTDIAFREGNTFISTFGSGILVTDASGNLTHLDEVNSPLANSEGDQSNITALANATHGLWVANYDGYEPLHLLKTDGTWESFSFTLPNEQHPTNLLVDKNGKVWITLDPESGGGLVAFDPEEKQAHYKTNISGNGALPEMNVRSMATDRDGYTWVGTDAGVAYFFSVTEDAIKPIYENRFLLRDEKITAIEVDAGNRKWIGTEQGVWLFNATGETLVQHFTSENSPLPSDFIVDIEINPETGEVFFSTDQGIISYRSDAIAAGPGFDQIRIFPNPVSPGYSGTVGISGLASDAYVRITDIGGKLVWQTQANGGMATWNIRNHQGRRAVTGIYLVFATDTNGTESMVGKVAVIE